MKVTIDTSDKTTVYTGGEYYTGVPEVDMQLRHAPCQKLGGRSL